MARALNAKGVPYTFGGKKGDSLSIEQTNGQLMGSILSFPILCLVNLIVYWSSLQDFLGISIPAENLPVLINGDDILFRSTDDFYLKWLSKLPLAGFKLSVGKNYTHPSVFTINSQCFTMITKLSSPLPETHELPVRQPAFFVETLYMNAGLLITSPDMTEDRINTVKPINELYNLVVGRATSPERAHRRFLHYHRHTIQEVTSEWRPLGVREKIPGFYNLFLPLALGGLGFQNFGTDYTVNATQRALAYHLRESRKQYLEPRVLSKKELSNSIHSTKFVLSDVAAKRSYPMREHNQITAVLRDSREPMNSGEFETLRDINAPPLFESIVEFSAKPVFKVVHPSKSTLRSLLRGEHNRRIFSSTDFKPVREDFYVFRFQGIHRRSELVIDEPESDLVPEIEDLDPDDVVESEAPGITFKGILLKESSED